MRRLKPEHSTECAARPHKAHEQDQLTEFCICEVIACAGEHDFINAPVIACEVLGKLYGRCRTRIGMRAIGRTAFRLAVPTAGGQRKRTAHLLQKRRSESPARKEGILEFRPRVEDMGRMAHEFFHGRPTGARRCNARHSRKFLLVTQSDLLYATAKSRSPLPTVIHRACRCGGCRSPW